MKLYKLKMIIFWKNIKEIIYKFKIKTKLNYKFTQF